MSFKQFLYRIPQTAVRASMPLVQLPDPPVLSGAGMVRRFPEVIAATGVNRVLIVCGPTVFKSGLMREFLAAMDHNGLEVVIFSKTEPNPTFENVYDAAEMYQTEFCDGIVGFGGGSAIDCAKAVGAKLSSTDRPLEKMRGVLKLMHRLPPLFAIPTTAGSGSEATMVAVVTNESTREKIEIIDPKLCPIGVVLDPKLTVTMPASLTAATGMDALTHAIESYIGRLDTEYVREHALDASRVIIDSLVDTTRDGDNLRLRARMQKAAFAAGQAFNRGSVGYVHSFAHAIGALYDLPHGYLCAIILPYILEFSKPEATEKLAELAYNAELGGADLTDDELAEALIMKIRAMNAAMGIPEHIAELQLEDISLLTERILAEANPFYPVPRIMDHDECVDLLGKLLPEEAPTVYGKNQ